MDHRSESTRLAGLLVLVLVLVLPAQTVLGVDAADQLVINEIMQNPSAVADSAGEGSSCTTPQPATWTLRAGRFKTTTLTVL